MQVLFLSVCRYVFFWWMTISAGVCAQDTAESLFSHHRHALYQVQIIEQASGNKSAIGSGFMVDRNDLIVTNYHVISDYIYNPEKFRIEYINSEQQRGTLSVINFDVVNDLALLRLENPPPSATPFTLASALPKQGMTVYSLGNPHDLGMIVVAGIFNGLQQSSFSQRIHFTGSINPGMSGGPAVNENGHVMGVNVATAGNQIGFLVPLEKLQELLSGNNVSALSPTQYKANIGAQLKAYQASLMAELLISDWTMGNLGHARIPAQFSEFLPCWGDSNSRDVDALYLSVRSQCRTQDRIYLNRSLFTGTVEVEYEWLSSEEFTSHRFYNFLSSSLQGANPGNLADEEGVTNYQCSQELTRNSQQVVEKTILCLRQYRDFPGLFDVLFVAASLDYDDKSLISHFTLAGVSRSNALAFIKKFMDAKAWQ